MFHWICPECGREIPPSLRECQACDPNAVAVEPASSRPAEILEPAPVTLAEPKSAELVVTTLAVAEAALHTAPAQPEQPVSNGSAVPEPVTETAAIVKPAAGATVEGAAVDGISGRAPVAGSTPVVPLESIVEAIVPTPTSSEPVIETAPAEIPAVAVATLSEPDAAESLEPTVETAPVGTPAVSAVAPPEPVAEMTPAAAVPEPVVEAPALPVETPAVSAVALPEPVAEMTPAAPVPEPVVEVPEETPPVSAAALPEPVAEMTPAAPVPEPVVEVPEETPAVSAAALPEPIAETTPAAAVPEPVVEVPVETPAISAAASRDPVAETTPEAAVSEPVVETPAPASTSAEAVVKTEPAEAPAISAAALPEPVPEIAPMAAVPEPVIETPAPASASAEAVVKTETVETPAVSEAALPDPVVETTPVAAVPEPAIEAPAPPVGIAAVSAAALPEPVVETTLATAAPASTSPEPVVETEPVENPAVSAAALPEPVAETTPPAAAPASTLPEVVIETLPVEPPAVSAAATELTSPAPVAETTPAAAASESPGETPAIGAAELSGPVGSAPIETPAAAEPVEASARPSTTKKAPHRLHEVPDPLLALAEEIRAAQASRPPAPGAPSTGLLELAAAVGVPDPEPVSAPPVSPSAARIQAVPHSETSQAEAATAVALLVEAEPAEFHELRPAAQPPEPQATAGPEQAALAEPQVQPAALAPESPTQPEGPTLPFAPMQDYTPATARSIMPVPPPPQILVADAGPRITLPGPTLPPELTRLQDANVVSMIGEDTAQRTKEAIPASKNAGGPGWLVSVLVMLLLLAAGLGIVFYLLPHTAADTKPAPTPAVPATTNAPVTGGSSPLAKFVEVTGFRIVTAADKKSEVQYLIVNHSDADISGGNVFVTLRSIKPGQAPVCRFSFKVPTLGPFESKEMSSPIGSSTRAVSLPDWQEIRAEVQISQ